LRTSWLLAALACGWLLAAPAHAALGPGERTVVGAQPQGNMRVWSFPYRAHNGSPRLAYLELPRWYGPRLHPPVPLVISPHGRAVSGRANLKLWGSLPVRGSFALLSPDGQGRRLAGYSWGSPGQVEDLARMPSLAEHALPWLRIERSKIYAFGGSMGGQETLLLLARHPTLLAGAAAFDSVSDFALQYREFGRLGCNKKCLKDHGEPLGRRLQSLARSEIGGSPVTRPTAFRERSPITYSRAIAASCVPLLIWWSPADRIVIHQQLQSGRLFWKLRQENPLAPISAYVGFWVHTHEMRAKTLLPLALARFGLLPQRDATTRSDLHVVPPPRSACSR
jgi:pimeloyl-ACP methyl ester carboxylesterase